MSSEIMATDSPAPEVPPTGVEVETTPPADVVVEVPVPCRRSATERLEEYFRFNPATESPSSVRNTVFVIAVLITAVTYRAVLSPPGGI